MKGVEQDNVPVMVACAVQRARGRHRAATSPDATLDDGTRNPVTGDVIHSQTQAINPLCRRHGKGLYGGDDLRHPLVTDAHPWAPARGFRDHAVLMRRPT